MASFRIYKYSEEDINEKKADQFVERLGKFSGDLQEREWGIEPGTVQFDKRMSCLTFELLSVENKNVLTLDGLKEMSFIQRLKKRRTL